MIISYFITGRVTIAISIGSVEVITKDNTYIISMKDYGLIFIRLNLIFIIKTNGKKYEVKRVE